MTGSGLRLILLLLLMMMMMTLGSFTGLLLGIKCGSMYHLHKDYYCDNYRESSDNNYYDTIIRMINRVTIGKLKMNPK